MKREQTTRRDRVWTADDLAAAIEPGARSLCVALRRLITAVLAPAELE